MRQSGASDSLFNAQWNHTRARSKFEGGGPDFCSREGGSKK